MQKPKKKLVKFDCCNTEILFTKFGEFKMCECGTCGYDHGDGYYCRTLGPSELIHFSWPEDEPKLYVCNECGEHDECHWECPTCGSDDMREE
ncbi:hypothetical protein PJM41_0067 [Salmonella phage vB_SenS_UTK0009]|uniref:Uncharacterized protein n=1 Tax=Salmonella phage vB_SenS_UTK0009 TaxID=3028908 RepID=A0AAE9ZMW5_9CAUD|nr:hypothetical protein PJM41_0067 [Salmonella phage vB_SenS_UTK0009]